MRSLATRWNPKLFLYLAGLIVLGLQTGCTTATPPTAWSQKQISTLHGRLVHLGHGVDTNEAAQLAEAAVTHSTVLARQYRAVWPPWLHNNLVNGGYRERGLCYHWANDLFARLNEVPLRTLEIQLVVARMDTRQEHNAIVVTARGKPLSEGLILDPWRQSGRLWWGPLVGDKYPWEPLPYDRVDPALQRFVTR